MPNNYVPDAANLPRDIQIMLSPYCKYINPKFKKMFSGGVARPLVYVD